MPKNYFILFFFFLFLFKAGVSYAQQNDSLSAKKTTHIYIAPGSKTNILEQVFYSESTVSEIIGTIYVVDSEITILKGTKITGSVIYLKKEANQAIVKTARQQKKTQRIALKDKPDYSESEIKVIPYPFSEEEHKHTEFTFVAASSSLTISKSNSGQIRIILPIVGNFSFQVKEEEKLTKNHETYGHTKSLQLLITYTTFSRPPTV